MIRVHRLERPSGVLSSVHQERVRFGDTDAAGIVYYANYYRWMESGRAELMRSAGFPYTRIVEQGLFMPVVECWFRYRTPARYDDLLDVCSWVHEQKTSSVLIGCEISRDGVLLAQGASRLGCLDEEGAPRRLPPELVRVISAGARSTAEDAPPGSGPAAG